MRLLLTVAAALRPVVDSDTDFSELCARMREGDRTSCTIVFCESDVFIEADSPGLAEPLYAEDSRSA